MASYREIVTKAVISKGKKVFTHQNQLQASNSPTTVLGCWVINHNFNGVKQNQKVLINGSYDINIWYSYDNDTKTDVIKETYSYNEEVKMNDPNRDYDNASIIVRSLTDPKCVRVNIEGERIVYDVELELGIELVGDTKVKIAVDENLDDYSLIEDEVTDEKIMDEIDNEVNTDYLESE